MTRTAEHPHGGPDEASGDAAAANPAAHEPQEGFVQVVFKGRRVEVYRNPQALPLRIGDLVLVEVERGVDIGTVLRSDGPDVRRRKDGECRPVLRIAGPEEAEQLRELRAEDGPALALVKERVARHGLPMHMLDAEFQFDRNRVTFYFTADHRIDFRELVRDLAAVFRTRIELRQIGGRDAARRLGGLGPCGREFCCGCFHFDFERVTLHMAREQNLGASPARLSGSCGRLLCCLGYGASQRACCPGPDEGGDVCEGECER